MVTTRSAARARRALFQDDSVAIALPDPGEFVQTEYIPDIKDPLSLSALSSLSSLSSISSHDSFASPEWNPATTAISTTDTSFYADTDNSGPARGQATRQIIVPDITDEAILEERLMRQNAAHDLLFRRELQELVRIDMLRRRAFEDEFGDMDSVSDDSEFLEGDFTDDGYEADRSASNISRTESADIGPIAGPSRPKPLGPCGTVLIDQSKWIPPPSVRGTYPSHWVESRKLTAQKTEII